VPQHPPKRHMPATTCRSRHRLRDRTQIRATVHRRHRELLRETIQAVRVLQGRFLQLGTNRSHRANNPSPIKGCREGRQGRDDQRATRKRPRLRRRTRDHEPNHDSGPGKQKHNAGDQSDMLRKNPTETRETTSRHRRIRPQNFPRATRNPTKSRVSEPNLLG
jgi:hypothetical protein